MASENRHILHRGSSIISIETLPDYSRPVVVKRSSERQPSRSNNPSLEKEYEMTRALDAVEGVRQALAQQSIENQPALILEYIDGETLGDCIAQKTLNLRARLETATDLARILEKIHQQNVIHLDLNSKNILIGDEPRAVYLIDLGSASRIDGCGQQKVWPDQMLGSLPYISPEQTGRINRSVDERSDLYSLGVVLYELMTRLLPFDAKDPLELIHHHIARVPNSPSEVSSEIPEVLSAIILKLLNKNAEDRYQSAAGVHADLEKCLQRLSPENTIEEFPLAEADYTSRLRFPQKLYGRDRELKELERAFESVCRDTSSIVLVGGYSGIGKTALVEEMHRPVSEKGGYFIRGKFDQYVRTTPYTAITQAFTELVSRILAEPERNFREWQDEIKSAVGDLGRVLTDVIPALQKLIGSQPDVPQLDGQEAANRFNYVFINFLTTVTSKERPLVLFFDDLQWIDAASLRLLMVIDTDFSEAGLLVIGAYRDNEVDNSHPLMDFINKREEKSIQPRLLKLEDLKEQHLEALLSDTLRTNKGINELEAIIFEITHGNPFFSRRLLSSLNEEGYIVYDSEINNWVWNIADIKSEAIAVNVADLLAKNIAALPEEIRKILTLAACIGNRFDIHTLALISGLSEQEVLKLLTESLCGQYVLETGKAFEFVHDHVQHAAYSLLDENSRINKHLEIARLLLVDTSESELEEKVFDIVTHYNLSAELVTNQEEKINIVELNLRAGRKARLAAAFAASAVYVRQGLTLLDESAWQDHYRLTLDVHSELIDVCHLNIQHEEVEALFPVITEHAKQEVDAAVAHKVLITSCVARHEIGRAISLAEGYLERLDVTLDSERESDLPIAELRDLPPMENREKLAAMEILMAISTPVILSASERFPSVVYTMLNLISRYGNNSLSGVAYTQYAMILCLMQRYQEGNRFGELAVDLLEKYPHPGRAAEIMNMQYPHVRSWMQSIHNLVAPLKTYHRMAVQAGSFEWGSYCLMNYTLLRWGSGTPLEHCLAELEPAISFFKSKNQQFTLQVGLMHGEAAQNLTGSSANTTLLEGKWFSEGAMMSRLSDNDWLLADYGLLKMQLHYLFGEPGAAYDHVDQVLKHRGSLNPHYLYTKISFYGGLACVAGLAEAEEDADRQDRLEKLEQFEKELALWAEIGPMNYLHEHLLLQAEKSRVTNDHWKAVQLYDDAIKAAQENGFVHEEALANELCARFWQERGNDRIAETYMREARALYHRWGAVAKVDQLEKCYPQWFQTESITIRKPNIPDDIGKIQTTITEPITPLQLDMESITSAGQLLAAETDLDQLCTKMITLVMANSGAEKAVLLLKHEDEWFVEARKDITTDEHTALFGQPFDPTDRETELIPESVFNYCQRTKDVLVLGDAQRDDRFAKDLMIQKQTIQSIACIPALSQGQLRAMLYLENSQTAHVFTSESISILKHFTAQFAISVENAVLYNRLNQKLAELQASEMRFRSVVENANETVIVTQDEMITFCNQKIGELTGYTQEEIRSGSFTRFVHPDDSQTVMHEYRNRLSGQSPANRYSIRIITKDGQEKFVLVNSALITWDDRPATLAMVTDITELRRSEEKMNQLRSELVHTSRTSTMGEMTAALAHELNHPLGSILNNANAARRFLEQDNPDLDEIGEIISDIISENRRASEVMQKVRNLMKKTEVGLAPVEINGVIEEVLKLTHSELIIENVSLSKQLAKDLPQVTGERVQLQQVFINLIMNAIDAMKESKPKELQCSTARHDAGNVVICIRDTGCGLGDREKVNLFKPFFTTKEEGLGMGLSVTKTIIKSHGGDIWAENNEGAGASFFVTLPHSQER